MKKKILIDTDVVIDFLKGVNKAVKYIKSHSDKIVLSVITVSELGDGISVACRVQWGVILDL